MDLKEVVSLAESLRGANLRRYTQAEIEANLKKLTDIYPMVGISRSAHQVWYRGRLCPSAEGYPSLLDCISPRPELLSDFGRANYPHEPVLYGAWNWTTVFGELRAEPGQFIQIIAVRVRPGLEIPHYTVGEYEHITNSGGSLVNSQKTVAMVEQIKQGLPPEEDLRIIFIDAFLADQFSRKAERPYEYKLTAAFAKYIFATGAGLMYPSVEVRGGINKAVTSQMFGEHFEVVCTWVVEVIDYCGYSVYNFRPRRFSCDFEENGKILWDSKKAVNVTRSLQGGIQFSGDVQGWRVPT